MNATNGRIFAVAVLGLAILTLSLAYWMAGGFAHNPYLTDRLTDTVIRAGPWLVVLLLALAIVATPIPSGPIAMVSGALYGTIQGGLLVILGAVLGAMIAFGLSRRVGRDILIVSSNPVAAWITRPRSQNMLTFAVLVSRLIPFLSFDVISYAAGLTPLAAWRFAAATGLGVVPVSFGLAAMGAGMVEDSNWTVAAIAGCGITVAMPIGFWLWHAPRERVLRMWKSRARKRQQSSTHRAPMAMHGPQDRRPS